MESHWHDHSITQWQFCQLEDVGLYLHFPFCTHKCVYCDFYSVTSLHHWDDFFDALEVEAQLWQEQLESRPQVRTMFWGGGTPSLMTPQQLETVVRIIERTFDLSKLREWTIECNPESLDEAKLRAYRTLGINRISIGVQSLHPEELQFLGRKHSAETAERAVKMAQDVGFDNLNVDLIFGLPNQQLHHWQETLKTIISWDPQHLSTYALTYESGTPLYTLWKKGRVQKIEEEQEAQMYCWTVEYLRSIGFCHYEISNFAVPGFECRHNLRYWQRKEYLGLGPSAHGFIGEVRYQNVRSVAQYWQQLSQQRRLPIVAVEELSLQQRLEEWVYLGLRSQGVELWRLKALGVPHADAVADEMVRRYPQWFRCRNNRLQLTAAGYALADALVVEFLTSLAQYSPPLTEAIPNLSGATPI